MIDGVYNIYSRYMEYPFFVMRDEAQHWLMRDLVHNIYTWEVASTVFIHNMEMEWPVFIHNIWSLQHLHMRDGKHSIYSSDMESTLIEKIWSP